MNRKGFTYAMVLGLFTLTTSPAFSGLLSRTYVFEPKKPTIVNNPLLWHLDTHCTIQSTDKSNKLSGLMTRKNGEMNGKALKQGQTGSVTVKNKAILHITADFGAQIEITNHGEHTVIAVCKI